MRVYPQFSILRKYTKFHLIHFGSVLNCQCRSIQTQVSIFQRSTIAALYKKGPGVCRGARPCAPLRFSHIPMWSTLCGLPQTMWHTAGSHNLCGYTTGVPQSMRHIRPKFRSPCGYTAEIPQSLRPFGRGLRSPCGHYFPIQNLENISLTRSSPSDSPRIRPRLSYASVRSME